MGMENILYLSLLVLTVLSHSVILCPYRAEAQKRVGGSMSTQKVHGRTLINWLEGQGVKVTSAFSYRNLPLELKVTISKVYLELTDRETLCECLPGETHLKGLLTPFLDSAITYAETIKAKIRALPFWNTADEIAELLSSEAVFSPEFEDKFGRSMKNMINLDPILFHKIVGEKIAKRLEKRIEAEIEEALPAFLKERQEYFQQLMGDCA